MPASTSGPLRIGVVMDRTEEVQMSLWFHAQRFLREASPCVFSLFTPDRTGLRRLTGWKPDGLVGYVQSPEVMSALLALDRPLVNVSGALGFDACPTVCPDNRAIGRLAAEHLITKNCMHFGFLGVPGHRYTDLQQAGFHEVLSRKNRPLSVFDGNVHPLRTIPPTTDDLDRNRSVIAWLQSLPDNTGLLIVDSWRGMRICDLATAAGIDLLATLAIVTGHDCDVPSVPSLSGVHIAEDQWSRQAVGLLLDLLAGKRVPDRPVLIQPTGVNERGSTARIMVDDDALRDALRYIQSHADAVISVDDVARAASLSRRALERRFRSRLGRTVLSEIHRVHIEQAKRLLIDTDLPMHAVATKAGLTDDRQLLRLFHQHEGTSPGAFRKRFRTT